jgi:hypothetical protein
MTVQPITAGVLPDAWPVYEVCPARVAHGRDLDDPGR